MAFTYDLTTNIGKIRLAIGDSKYQQGVRPDNCNFSNEEITAILTDASNDVNVASAVLMEILSREWALLCDITLGPRKEAYSQVSKRYTELAKQMRDAVGGNVLSVTTGFKRDDEYQYLFGEDASTATAAEYVPEHRYPSRL